MGNKGTKERLNLVNDDGVFKTIPTEVVCKIASKLKTKYIVSFCRVSHTIQTLLTASNSLWNFLLQRDFESTKEFDYNLGIGRFFESIQSVPGMTCSTISII
jgi:hypothetical protein